MKQKLLLALLALFTSMGMVKAEKVTFTAEANSGEITISLGSASGKITYTGPDKVEKTTTSSSFKFANSGNEGEFIVDGAFKSITISSYYKGVKSIAITNQSGLTALTAIGEKIEKITGESALTTLNISQNKVASLNDFSSFTELTNLNCSSCGLTSLVVPAKLTTLNCADNQLTGITRGDEPVYANDGTLKNQTFGTQILSSEITEIANSWFDMANLVGDKEGELNLFPEAHATKTTYGSFEFEKNSTYSATSFAVKHPNASTYPTQYKFYSSTQYEPGKYRVMVRNTDAKFAGRTFKIGFSVGEGKFDIIKDDKNTKVTGTGISDDKVTQGNTLTLKAVVPANKLFDSFTVKGLSTPTAGESTTTVTVLGPKPSDTDQNVSVVAIFKAKQATLTITPVEGGGSFQVKEKGKTTLFANGAKINYGTILEIVPSAPSSDYEVDFITVNGKVLEAAEGKYTFDNVQTGTIIVTGAFKKKVASGNKLTITMNQDILTGKDAATVSIAGVQDNLTFTDGSATVTNFDKTTVSLKITYKDELPISVNDILMNGTSIGKDKIFKNGNDIVATFTRPTGATTIAIEANKLSKLTVTLPETKMTYTGAAAQYSYQTTPANISGGVLTFAETNAEFTSVDDKYMTTVPKNVGYYLVKYKRNADALFAETTAEGGKLTIKQASLPIKAPTVTTALEGGILKYKISGTTTYNGVAGAFTIKDNTTFIVPEGKRGKSHLVTVVFTPTSDINKQNYTTSEMEVPAKVGNTNIEMHTITAPSVPSSITVQIKNGNGALLPLSTPIAKGTKIDLVFTTPPNLSVETVSEDAASGTVIENPITVTNNVTASEIAVTNSFAIKVTTKTYGAATNLTINNLDAQPAANAAKILFDGTVKTYDSQNVTIDDEGTFIITYELDGQAVTSPINAGVYKVICTATPKADDKAHKVTVKTTTLTISKATPTVTTWPTASKIGKGQTLASSSLTGGAASVAGMFTWVEPSIKPETSGQYAVKFIPKDDMNYESVYSNKQTPSADVKVEVTDKAIISLTNENGTITAKDAAGKTYISGDEVIAGTVLTFTATPAQGYELLTPIKVNGTALSGNTFTMGAVSIAVTADFTMKPFTVTTTTSVKGVIITLPASNKVKKGESYEFTLAHLAADKPVVKDGATVIAGVNGKYTISNVQSDKNITITLANPTAISVKAESTLSPGNKEMGKIEFKGLTDGKCFYGDEVTATATPVPNVKFAGWEGLTSIENPLKMIVKGAITLKANYTGSPVGIESIEGMKLEGGLGHIFVSCDGTATLTIVSMNGQSAQIEVSGETRIERAAGVYGVVLQQGSVVLKTKVVVR